MTVVADLDDVTVRYGRIEAVRAVSLDLPAGQRLALIGHNGAGKTTLMKLLLGLIRPTRGHVRVLGDDPAGGRHAAALREVGFLPENVAFHEAMTGGEVLRFYARLKRRPAKECAALLERVGLARAAGRRVRTYSKGMRQRLGLAQALLGEPRLLLLDEPTTGLDPDLRAVFYDILRERARTGGAVLLSSHILTELEERTDRIAVMDRGRLVAAGTLDELRRRAGLPVRLRLRVAPGQAAAVAARLNGLGGSVDGNRVILECRWQDKLEALRRVTALGPEVEDVDIEAPGLAAVYARFTSVGEAP